MSRGIEHARRCSPGRPAGADGLEVTEMLTGRDSGRRALGKFLTDENRLLRGARVLVGVSAWRFRGQMRQSFRYIGPSSFTNPGAGPVVIQLVHRDSAGWF